MGWGSSLARALALLAVAYSAYDIRLHAIREFGRVIHEFDPWFNFRATQYLADHGWSKFFKWFDYMSWYPLGRPIGTTIYPGMQITAVAIWRMLKATGLKSLKMSLNDVCCFVPAWFGVSATLLVGLITTEASRSPNAGVAAAAVMAIVPAHLMRSVGGGYDNESIALTALNLTFYLWVRSVRNERSWPVGVLTGLAYTYMVAAWGGYIFVLNMIALHAGMLVLLGRYTSSLHRAYSLFYIIGTYGAMCVPVVGWTPLKSLEQLGAFGVFAFMQLLELSEVIRRQRGLSPKEAFKLRTTVFSVAALAAALVVATLYPTGYFGPLSSRVRGLFVKHTRTGNPLVDSVAEHQPASNNAYFQYLQVWTCYLAPVGWLYTLGLALLAAVRAWLSPEYPDQHFDTQRVPAKSFLLAYGIVGYYFCNKMVRLIILLGPVASALSGITAGLLFDWAVAQFGWLANQASHADADDAEEDAAAARRAAAAKASEAAASAAGKGGKPGKPGKAAEALSAKEAAKEAAKRGGRKKGGGSGSLGKLSDGVKRAYNAPPMRVARVVLAVGILWAQLRYFREFYDICQQMAAGMSQPSIMFKAHLRDGQPVIIDDYREAYWWLRDNTPADSRVMAWWDYGYQITGIANRTTIADGNTWNHEHIATLGRCLTAPEVHAHRIVRHLADYVLVWAGGGGDDLAKSPHMARIGNSVYDDICPGDPTCRQFGFYAGGTPTPMMENSLLYKLHSHNHRPGVQVDPSRFREVYTSKYGKVRIFKVLSVSKESKEWVADRANRVCDAPGSWYCSGQYPPALDWLAKKKKAFKQLEDFNVGSDESAKKYYDEYMARMEGRGGSGDGGGGAAAAGSKGKAKDGGGAKPGAKKKSSKADPTMLRELIEVGDADGVAYWLATDPNAVKIRSEDGRGPLWWAYESGQAEVAKLLLAAGAPTDEVDKQGKRPADLKR